MRSSENSLKVPAYRILFSVIVCIVAGMVLIVSPTSCNRGKTGIASFTMPEPPQLPPPPPKAPSMVGSDTTWDMIDQYPMFPGGEELLRKYVAMNTRYPDEALKKGLQGTVVVKFRITSKGKVDGHVIAHSVCPELDAEALRVVMTITRFEPAIVDGKPVSAWYHMPITFALK